MKCCGIADFFPYITTKKHAVFIPGRLCDTQGDKPLAINQSAIAGFPWALRKSMVPNRQHNVPNRPWIVAPSVSKLDICPWAKRRRCLPQALSSAPRWSKHSMDNSPLFIDQFAIETPFAVDFPLPCLIPGGCVYIYVYILYIHKIFYLRYFNLATERFERHTFQIYQKPLVLQLRKFL